MAKSTSQMLGKMVARSNPPRQLSFSFMSRPSRSSSPDDAPDPALQGLTTEELYRMIELLDLVKAGREDKMNSDDLKMLEFLMGQYQA